MAGNRRTFLKTAGFTAAALAAAPIGAAIPKPALAADRSFVAGKFALELDEVFQGIVLSTDGGDAYADVIDEPPGVGGVIHKHIGQPEYEDIRIALDMNMESATYDWIKHCMDHSPERKNGAIIAADFNYKELSRLSFSEALITEIAFPALDAASKDPAKMTLKFAPESTRRLKGSGATLKANTRKGQKTWLVSNFRISIDGLEAACTKVNKIEALVVKQKFLVNSDGEVRDIGREPAKLEIPNLTLTVPESAAQEWIDWADDFIIKGNNGDDKERNGTLDFLSPNLAAVLGRLSFSHLGIFKCTPEKSESNSDSIRRFKVEMYCEEMRFLMPVTPG